MVSLTDWDISAALDKSFEQEPRWPVAKPDAELKWLVWDLLANQLGELPGWVHDYTWIARPCIDGGVVWCAGHLVTGACKSGWTLGGKPAAAGEIAHAVRGLENTRQLQAGTP